MILIKNGKVITEYQVLSHGWVLCENGKIKAYDGGNPPDFQHAQVIDAQGGTITAGFIDLHVHGAMGVEMMDSTPESLTIMSRFFVQHGVTSYLPTTLTATHEQLLVALENVARNAPPSGSKVLGVHLEGPYLNVKKCGAQKPEYIRTASPQEAHALLDTGVIRLLALAPEFEANHWLIQECVQRGITVSIAHTEATYEQAMQGIALGIRQSTHTYNAMTGLHHRQAGVVGAVLGDERVRCEIISDGVHVHGGAVKVLWRAKGRDGTIIITDAMRAAGMPEGDYLIGEHIASVKEGQATLKDGTLAGSVATYDHCVRQFMAMTNTPFEDMWQATSLTPAKAIGIDHQKGSIRVGKDADLVLLDDRYHVTMSLVEGVLYPTETPANHHEQNAQ